MNVVVLDRPSLAFVILHVSGDLLYGLCCSGDIYPRKVHTF